LRKLFILIFTLFTFNLTANENELIVALGQKDYPPFYFIKDGKYQGSSMEIAEIVAKRLGYKLVFKRYPWSRVLSYLEHGHVDMVLHFFNTAERASSVVYAGVPHIFESSYLFVNAKSNISYSGNLEKMKAYRFSNVRGYSHGVKYDSASYLNKTTVTSEVNLIKMLTLNRFDIAVGNKPTILMYAKQDDLNKKIKFLSPPIDKAPSYMAFSRIKSKSKALAAAFTEEIVAFKKTDEYKNILKKYGFSYPIFTNTP